MAMRTQRKEKLMSILSFPERNIFVVGIAGTVAIGGETRHTQTMTHHIAEIISQLPTTKSNTV